MVRLIIILLLIAALALAAASVITLLRSVVQPVAAPGPERGDPMPDTIRNVAFGLLLVLLLGVATGWLGA
jgi:cell division protein FtsX